ncbi:MAG: hypothetical protein IPI81_11035 [Flavobacteriales bacterium]|nr:hypothetical protein [Flavobacteriales bacterium]MCC6936778.1 hypothetical protein [Flavobacteriales bacterium]
MADKLFVIGIGGTGMRCLEAFTHLCAMGMFDNQEIEVLTLDTDRENGNKARTESLIELYNRVKTTAGQKGGTPNASTFFSAKLNLHRFFTNYEDSGRRDNYINLARLASGSPKEQEDNKDLSDLFLDPESVQLFDLSHGYRAQTHLGSHLMYHGIVDAARHIAKGGDVAMEEKELDEFLAKMAQAGPDARIFVFGSVFGGTGASSIPILPEAFKDAILVRSNGNTSIDFAKTKFGATLLTEYFAFKKPDAAQKSAKANRVIADSQYFPLNSQAALQFYQNDPTVQRNYKMLYHVGWPVESKPYEELRKEDKTITGGADQRNPCHITELLCACAAFDFFTRTDGLTAVKAEYLYRAAPFKNGAFHFKSQDLVGADDKVWKKFADRSSAMLAFAHIALHKNGAASGGMGVKWLLSRFDAMKLKEYETVSEEETKEIDEYLRRFAYNMPGGNFEPGWIYQVRGTVSPGQFIFKDHAFAANKSELDKLDVGELLEDEKHHWEGAGFAIKKMDRRYDGFVRTLIEGSEPKTDQNVTQPKEKFIAHISNALTISHRIINN